MAKIPALHQLSYRGRIRATMQSATNHLANIVSFEARRVKRQELGPSYPTAWADAISLEAIVAALGTLRLLLAHHGPIPGAVPGPLSITALDRLRQGRQIKARGRPRFFAAEDEAVIMVPPAPSIGQRLHEAERRASPSQAQPSETGR